MLQQVLGNEFIIAYSSSIGKPEPYILLKNTLRPFCVKKK